MRPNPHETVDLVTFTEEILNGKLHFLCSVLKVNNKETNNAKKTIVYCLYVRCEEVLDQFKYVTHFRPIFAFYIANIVLHFIWFRLICRSVTFSKVVCFSQQLC